MVPEQYTQKMDEFFKTKNFSLADKAFLKKLDSLSDELLNMINENEETPFFSGTAYYISNDGNDENDGKYPKTAWKTLEHIRTVNFAPGDALLFRRGDEFRGNVIPQNGVTYSAYGCGKKPKIISAIDSKKYGKWLASGIPNIWKYSEKISENEFFLQYNNMKIKGEPRNDINLIVFDSGKAYAKRKYSIADLKNDLDFVYNSVWSVKENFDDCIYIYSEICPDERFDQIDISIGGTVFNMPHGTKNVRINNLEILMGGMSVWGNAVENFKMDYCITGFMGGCLQSYAYNGAYPVPRGGGAGCWHSCNGFVIENCYIYEQFDSGVTPQYNYIDEAPSIFDGFVTRNCLFEGCEYTLEYFTRQTNTNLHRYRNMYFGYNICRKGGKGFGCKHDRSAYIKSWNHQNFADSITIEHNIFDRAAADTINIGARDYDGNPSYEFLPKMINNLYIQKKDKKFGDINKEVLYFNKEGYDRIKELNFEDNPVFVFEEE